MFTMLNLKVVAKSINNLTDARYFAAFGVEWLGFDINPANEDYIDIDRLVEIGQWVEGPSFLIQGAKWNPEFKNHLELEVIKNGAVLIESTDEINRYPGYQLFSSTIDVPADLYLFDSFEEYEDSGIDPSFSYIQYQWDIQLIHDLLKQEKPPGILLTGGKEQKIGVKSFEQLDEVFDLLSF